MWPAGARFSFNTYRHFKVLVLQGCTDLVHNKEVVTQGEPLFVTLYSLGVLHIIHSLTHHVEHTEYKSRGETLQLWYANDSALGSSF